MPDARSFLAIGECMVEMAPTGDGLYRMGFAGDSFNTAWYARRLLPPDWMVGYVTCVGDDAMSRAMLQFMGAQGIDTGTVRRLPDRTVGLYAIRLEQGERSFSYWRGQSAARALADDPEWLDRVLAGRDLLFFSGITLAILPPEGREVLATALARARAAGATIAFDTNLRPRLWESPEAMRAGLMLGGSVADIVLPSFDEETGLFGDARPEETIARYRDLGAALVAVKNGHAPAHVWSAETGARTHTPRPVERIIDSTAAGDSFDAGLLTGLLTGASLPEATDRAMALAARVICRRGALAPDLFEEDTE